MNIATPETESKVVVLISIITGQVLNQQDVTPSVKFLTALVTVLVGVINADREATQDEKQRLQNTLYRFSNPNSMVRQLTQSMVKGVIKNKLFTKSDAIVTLTQSFSDSKKLLLIAFGYDMSAADGDIDIRERQYLEEIAKLLRIDSRYLKVLEAGFSNKENIDIVALDEVKYLLAPARFQNLDVAFIKATNDMLAVLPNCQKPHEINEQIKTSYQALQKFQQACQKLDKYCYQLFQIIQEYNEDNFISDTLLQEIDEISHKLKSQNFRIAVVGEFSQGKSTLLNALLGEEIQPVRAIPCSGTITVLKYGTEKRVICRYKDGREEEIPVEQYQEKAAISEEAALDGISDELATSEIKEIIFEHPDLKLCRHGVEIVDSPGLNEHPERTSITQQLIKDTDAIIFLTNASRPLTQGERELIQELRLQLNGGKADIPAENLFILVNFMDLLRREEDRETVKQRIKRFVQGDNPIIAGQNRIHFISAQAALDAIIDGYENDYLNTFNYFTQSIETFLTDEIGKIKINKNLSRLENIIEQFKHEQHQHKQNLFEYIGTVSAWDVESLMVVNDLQEETINECVDSWNAWIETLGETIYDESERWVCSHDNEEKVLKIFTRKLNDILTKELTNWLEDQIKNQVLKDSLAVLDELITSIREAIEDLFNEFDTQAASDLKEQFQLSLNSQSINMNIDKNNIDSEDGDGVGLGLGLGGAGLVAAGLFAFTGIGLIPLALTALGSGFGIGALFGETKEAKIKRVVLKKGLENLALLDWL
jgi:tellurite resistance protein/GTPase SAR1 family protein